MKHCPSPCLGSWSTSPVPRCCTTATIIMVIITATPHDHHDHDDHHHDAHDHHAHHGHHHDSNMRAAYVHVLADALTSVLAIVALLGGKYYGLTWMDPAMGLVGAAVIIAWAVSLIRSSGAVLLDTVPNTSLSTTIRTRLEVNGDKVADLHLWRLGPGHTGVIAALVSDRPQPPAIYKERLHGLEGPVARHRRSASLPASSR